MSWAVVGATHQHLVHAQTQFRAMAGIDLGAYCTCMDASTEAALPAVALATSGRSGTTPEASAVQGAFHRGARTEALQAPAAAQHHPTDAQAAGAAAKLELAGWAPRQF